MFFSCFSQVIEINTVMWKVNTLDYNIIRRQRWYTMLCCSPLNSFSNSFAFPEIKFLKLCSYNKLCVHRCLGYYEDYKTKYEQNIFVIIANKFLMTRRIIVSFYIFNYRKVLDLKHVLQCKLVQRTVNQFLYCLLWKL